MQQDGYTDYLDFYQRGPNAPYLKEHRLVGSTPVGMFKAAQPAMRSLDPPLPDLAIVLGQRYDAMTSIDVGAGRWRGRYVKGDLTLVPASTASDIAVDGAHEILVVTVPCSQMTLLLQEACGREVSDFGVLHAAPFRDAWIEALCERMWAEAESGHPLGSLFCDSAVLTLGAALLRKAELVPPPATVRRGGLANYRLRRVQGLLQDRLADDLSLDELAAAAGLSLSHFARAFRAETGETPWRYLLARRVERAQQLLAATKLSIPEVAQACGFADQSHLGAWFKRLTGATPRQYRQDRQE